MFSNLSIFICTIMLIGNIFLIWNRRSRFLIKFRLVFIFLVIRIREVLLVQVFVCRNIILCRVGSIKKINYMGLGLRRLIIHFLINLDAIIEGVKMDLFLKEMRSKFDITNIVKIFS